MRCADFFMGVKKKSMMGRRFVFLPWGTADFTVKAEIKKTARRLSF